MSRFPRTGWRLAQLLALLALFSFGANARAHTYVVTDTNDTTAVTSLRGAIIAANQNGGENTIILGEGPRKHEPAQMWTFYLTIQGANEYAAQTGDLDITGGRLTITGAVAGVTINANGLGDRVFHVYEGASLDLENVTVQGGSKPFPQGPGDGGGIIIILGGGGDASGASMAANARAAAAGSPAPTNGGGGILNNGTMTMRDCLVVSNSTFADDGGGAILNTGSLTMENCAVANNSTAYDGVGTILNTGSLTMFNCNISGNSGDNGSGIYNRANLTLNGCVIISNGAVGDGGGVHNDVAGAMEMKACLISSNNCGGNGAGVCNLGSMKLHDCVLEQNICGNGNGGGIHNEGELIAHQCTISSNIAGTGGGPNGDGGNGGGIDNLGTLWMKSCTVSWNTAGAGAGFLSGNVGAGGNGGGVYSTNFISMVNCTISGNSAGIGGQSPEVYGPTGGGIIVISGFGANAAGGNGGSGGGIYAEAGFSLSCCTVVGNSAGAGGPESGIFGSTATATNVGGTGGSGGGIYHGSGDLSSKVENVLVALNTVGAGGTMVPPPTNGIIGIFQPSPGTPGVDGTGPDVVGAFQSGGFNLIGAVDGSSGFVNGVGADQVGSMAAPIDPMIGPLAMNGGPTPTHALLPNSPAVDKGDSFGIDEDQRGHPRPYNFRKIPNAAGGDGSDIGAFELDRADERGDEERK